MSAIARSVPGVSNAAASPLGARTCRRRRCGRTARNQALPAIVGREAARATLPARSSGWGNFARSSGVGEGAGVSAPRTRGRDLRAGGPECRRRTRPRRRHQPVAVGELPMSVASRSKRSRKKSTKVGTWCGRRGQHPLLSPRPESAARWASRSGPGRGRCGGPRAPLLAISLRARRPAARDPGGRRRSPSARARRSSP